MNRAGLFIALAVAVAGGAVFALFPQLDLAIERLMYERIDPGFAPDMTIQILREVSRWAVFFVALPAFVAVALKWLYPARPTIMPARAALVMIVSLALGPGITTNVVLKDHWGRPRPVTVKEFGGPLQFVPWWDPRGECQRNCSFVAGEPSGAFWTIAAASYAPPQWRLLAYGGALAFGLLVGFLRMAAGGHFASDVLFAGVITFMIVWLTRAWIYRWPRTRTTDEAIERTITRFSLRK